jgi:hypothetical protein
LDNSKNKIVKWSDIVKFTPKQKLATETADRYGFTLYGGAAGGGKSYWLRWYPIRWLIKKFKETSQKSIVAGLFCEDYPALKDRHLGKMKNEIPEWLGEIKDSNTYGLSFILRPEFGSGVLALRNLDDPSKYFSSEFALVAIDELTKNQRETFDFLRMRKRWPGISDTKFIAGTNPGSIGHEWVKKVWLLGQFDDNEQEKEEFKYVPATVDDNPHLSEAYHKALASLPDRLRKAYKEGNWDIFEGQYFTEFDQNKHVIDPFEVPDSWPRYRSIDVSGRNGITCCLWFAIDRDKRIFNYKEYYSTGRDTDEHAREITRLSVDRYGNPEEYKYTIMDSSAWDRLGLPETTAQVYQRNGVNGLLPSSKNRIMGWDFVHQGLRWDYNDKYSQPRVMFFRTCVNILRTLPTLIHDDIHPEDLDSKGEDHAADALRYFLQTVREQKGPEPMGIVERRLQEIKDKEYSMSFNYSR